MTNKIMMVFKSSFFRTPGILILLTILVLGMGSVLVPSKPAQAAATTYYVAKNGSNSNPGTEAQPWLTIQKAASTMVAGDTVYVKSGTYNEIVSPANSGASGQWISYKEYPGAAVIVDGYNLSAPYAKGIFFICKSYIALEGFEIKNANNSSLWTGVYAYTTGASNLSLKNLVVHHTYASGIMVVGTWNGANKLSNVTIDGCETYDTNTHLYEQEGISLVSVTNFEIKNCRVHDTHQEGIDLKVGTSNGSVHDNEIYNVKVGLYIDPNTVAASDIAVYQNEIHDCRDTGISLGSEGAGHPALTNLKIYNNLIYYNTVGFNALPYYFNKTFSLVNNTFYNNTHGGIVITDGAAYQQNCVIRNNIIMGNHGAAYPLLGYKYYPTGVTIDHNLYYDALGYNSVNLYGTNSIISNPLFAVNNLSLSGSSPALNAGSAIAAPASDYIGTARPQGAGYDIGAFEYISVEYIVWDVNKDGQVDVLDMILNNKQMGASGSPGWIPEDVNKDGVVNVLDSIIIGQHFTG